MSQHPQKKEVKKEVKKVLPKGEFNLTASLEGENHIYYGDTILSCLEQFSDEFRGKSLARGKTDLHLENGDLKADQFLFPMHTKRLFLNKIYREIIAKRLTLKLT